jgi:hypothetical protein
MARDAALGRFADRANDVNAAGRTFWKLSVNQSDIGFEIIFSADIAVVFVVFQGPLVFGVINLGEVVDANVAHRTAAVVLK